MNFQPYIKIPYNHKGKKINQPVEDCMGRFKFWGLSVKTKRLEKNLLSIMDLEKSLPILLHLWKWISRELNTPKVLPCNHLSNQNLIESPLPTMVSTATLKRALTFCGTWIGKLVQEYKGPVHPAYNPSFSAGTVFFSYNKSANSVFQPAYQHSRTGPMNIHMAKE
jgi:hypothetical protein